MDDVISQEKKSHDKHNTLEQSHTIYVQFIESRRIAKQGKR